VFAFPPPGAHRCRVFATRPKLSASAGTLIIVLPPRCLHDDQAGCWRIVTQTSVHLIDLDRRTVTRVDGAGSPTAGARLRVSALRRDGESLDLLEIVCCEIGCPMQLLIRIRDDCATLRRTTAVHSISPSEEWSPRAARP